jgi:hypothetical protein
LTPLDFVSYPRSHSAAMTVLWSVLYGGAVYAFTRDRAGALVSGLLVASHWALDFVSHRADLPLWPGGPKVGLGLWYSVPATLVVGALIPATEQTARELGRVRIGDLVTLQGKLVDVEIRDGRGAVAARMRTSLSRDDVGSGACEIVWVESVEIDPDK